MIIPLEQFKELFPEHIHDRGLSYYLEGRVRNIDVLAPGIIEAHVTGATEYRVTITIKNDGIQTFACDCPYDAGPICKHIAALVLALLHGDHALKEERSQGEVISQIPQKKTTLEKVEELLVKLSDEEVRQYVKDRALRDSHFRKDLLQEFVHLIP